MKGVFLGGAANFRTDIPRAENGQPLKKVEIAGGTDRGGKVAIETSAYVAQLYGFTHEGRREEFVIYRLAGRERQPLDQREIVALAIVAGVMPLDRLYYDGYRISPVMGVRA